MSYLSVEDNLLELSKPVFLKKKNKKTIMNLPSSESAQREWVRLIIWGIHVPLRCV